MNNDDIHGLSGAYAVDDVERARFEAHLAGCDTCRDEVSSPAASELAAGPSRRLRPPCAHRYCVTSARSGRCLHC
jgi:hypothetical protein